MSCGGASQNDWLPFDVGPVWEGDSVRLKDGIVKRIRHGSGLCDIEIGGVGIMIHLSHLSAIAAVRRQPEPLKVGDIVRHPTWASNYKAEIAAVKDGRAVFWPADGNEYLPCMPVPLGELERVK